MRRIIIVIGLTALAGCNGSASSAPFVGTPTPGASATPTPGATLQFTATGYALPFAANEAGYAGALTATSSDCSGIATFSPASGAGSSLPFTVTAVAAGKCHVTITDAANQKSVVTVDVTTLTGTIQ